MPKPKKQKVVMSEINLVRAVLSGGITSTFPDKKELSTFRCTIPAHYNFDCPGRTDPRSRQGYYRRAISLEHAIQQLEREFPGDKFEGELWNK